MHRYWLLGWLLACVVSPMPLAWSQDKPPIELPEVVIVGKDVLTIHDEKAPIAPRTTAIGLQSAEPVGKVPHLTPAMIGQVAGPVAENPGCLLFSGIGGNKDEALYKRGLKRYNSGDDLKARALFLRLTEEYPSSAYRGAAAFWWGESHFRQGENAEALTHYERVISSYRREPLRDYALHRAAELRLQREDYDRAAAYAATLRSQYPASPMVEGAHYTAGEVAFRQGRYDDALAELDTFLSRYPQSTSVERARLIRGESLYHMGRYPEAETAYRRFLEQHGTGDLSREARYGLAWSQLKQGQVAPAQQSFQALDQQYSETRFGEATQYAAFAQALQSGNEREAQRQLQHLRRAYPGGALLAAAWSEWAWARFQAREYRDALQWYQQLRQSPHTPEATRDVAQFMIGENFYQLQRYAEAIAALRNVRSEAAATLREKVAFRLGLSLYHQGEYDQAVRVLQAFGAHYPTSTYRDDGIFWLSEAQFRQGDFSAALRTSQQLRSNSRLHDYALHHQGWTYLQLRQWTNAVNTFQQVVQHYPKSAVRADALYQMGESYRQMGELTTAQEVYERYLQQFPQGLQASAAEFQLVLFKGQEAHLEDKIDALQRLQQQYPGTSTAADAQHRLGTLYFQQSRFAEARQTFESFAAEHPRDARVPSVRLRIADTYYNAKEYQASLIGYRKVMLLYPDMPEVADARYGVVQSHYQLGDEAQFMREAQAFIRDVPAHPLSESLLLLIAEYFQEKERLQEAISTYTYMITTYANQPLAAKARYRLGELYLATDKPQEASDTFEVLIQAGEGEELKADALFGQAKAYEALGEPRAVTRYAQIAADYPESPLAARGLYRAGRLAQSSGDYAQARDYFRQAVLRYPHDAVRYESWLQWGVSLLDLKQPKQALDVLEEAKETTEAPIAAQAQWHIGRAHALNGNMQKSINAYLQVAYRYPDQKGLVAEALRQAARNYVTLGKCPEALSVYAKLRQEAPSGQLQQAIQQEIVASGCQS